MIDGALISQLLLWAIGGISLVGWILTMLAFWSLGRSAYRKD